MKTRLLASALLLMSGLAVADRPPSGGPHGFDIEKLEILLDLDGYQKQEVQKILETQREARRAKREQLRTAETRPSVDQMKTEREAAQKATRAELAKVLSEKQLQKLDVLTEQAVQGGKRRRGAREQ